MNIPVVLKVYDYKIYERKRMCARTYVCIEVCFNTLWGKERKNMNTACVYTVLKCEEVNVHACTPRVVCVREKETCRVSISRKHWTNIDVSSLPFLSRDEKRVVLFIYQLLSSISEWKRGRARNCVNPCPFFSLPLPPFPFFIFPPYIQSLHKVTKRARNEHVILWK